MFAPDDEQLLREELAARGLEAKDHGFAAKDPGHPLSR
jgi:hypothetical protein